MASLPATSSAASEQFRTRVRLALFLQRHGVFVALAVVFLFASIRYESFLTPENLLNVLRQNSLPGLIALGMTCVILTGGIDLSVGTNLAVGGVMAAALSSQGSLLAAAVAIAVSTLIGLANGAIVAWGRVQPFITTLVTALAARGLLLACTQEQTIRVAKTAGGISWLGRGWTWQIPVPVVILFSSYLVGWIVLTYTRFGRHFYAVGDNDEAARLMGLNVERIRLGAYGVSGALAGLTGVLLAGRVGAGQPVAGAGWELNVITAVVVGGSSLAGGQGGAGRTLIGVLLLAFVFNAFNLEGALSSYWQWILRGVFLLLVVMVHDRLGARAGATAGELARAAGTE